MSKLILVPTPIGNLEDITLRGLRILQEADVIFAEDTRVTKKLLTHYNIDKLVLACHQHNEHQQLDYFIRTISSYQMVAMVTDAGTPGISDPGFMLVRACLDAHIEEKHCPVPPLLCRLWSIPAYHATDSISTVFCHTKKAEKLP